MARAQVMHSWMGVLLALVNMTFPAEAQPQDLDKRAAWRVLQLVLLLNFQSDVRAPLPPPLGASCQAAVLE